LPATILRRLPVRLNFDDNYYHAKHQGVPLSGYTAMVERMLGSRLIDVRLGEDFDQATWRKAARRLIFTGQPDAYLGYQFGELPYRSLRFESERIETPDYQGNAIINHADLSVPFTRSVEHNHFLGRPLDHTIVTREYPVAWQRGGEAFYPIVDDAGRALHQRYKAAIEADGDVVVGGRLGSFRYFDMDQAIGAALSDVSKFAVGYTPPVL
jgi:UDP-galactopyranose mutase